MFQKQCKTCGQMFRTLRRHTKTCSTRCRMKMSRYVRAEIRRVECLRRLKAAGFPIADAWLAMPTSARSAN